MRRRLKAFVVTRGNSNALGGRRVRRLRSLSGLSTSSWHRPPLRPVGPASGKGRRIVALDVGVLQRESPPRGPPSRQPEETPHEKMFRVILRPSHDLCVMSVIKPPAGDRWLNQAMFPALTLVDYKSLTSHLPRPTAQQMEDFAEFVSGAHSWYKHLPPFPPTAELHFFLDPAAGMQLVEAADGSIRVRERHENGFHHSWIPTLKYRHRFGYLAFCKSAGTSVSLGIGDARVIPSDDAPLVYDLEREQLRRIPEAVLHAGGVLVSGLLHTLAAHAFLWTPLEPRSIDWPRESGGSPAFQAIVDRCRLLSEDPSLEEPLPFEDPRVRRDIHLAFVDYPLHQLISPERRRQQREMVAAMAQMLDTI